MRASLSSPSSSPSSPSSPSIPSSFSLKLLELCRKYVRETLLLPSSSSWRDWNVWHGECGPYAVERLGWAMWTCAPWALLALHWGILSTTTTNAAASSTSIRMMTPHTRGMSCGGSGGGGCWWGLAMTFSSWMLLYHHLLRFSSSSLPSLGPDSKKNDGKKCSCCRNPDATCQRDEVLRASVFSKPQERPLSKNVPSSPTALLSSPPPPTSSHPPPPAQRYLELLVHNVSHSDLVLSCLLDDDASLSLPVPQPPLLPPKEPIAPSSSLAHRRSIHNNNNNSSGGSSNDPYLLCRPRFSCFDLYSRKALEVVEAAASSSSSSSSLQLVYSPRYLRALDSPQLRIQTEPARDRPDAPIGLVLPTPLVVDDWHDLRVRGRDQSRVVGVNAGAGWENQVQRTTTNGGRIGHVFFPLLATLLPLWQERLAEKYGHVRTHKQQHIPMHRVLILVTGVGTPRNWTHSVTGNSTAAAADLMRLFLQQVDPTLHVVHIHSETNIFRYDENLLFVERELLPTLEAYRDAHARGLPYPNRQASFTGVGPRVRGPLPHSHSHLPRHDAQHPVNPDWLKSFAVTLSFADGSPARTHAIQACLRPYRPTYYHFWQLKTFWHECKIVDDDIEVHAFEAMNTVPPMDVQECTDPWITAVVNEMKRFALEMNSCHRDRFWLRKTQKPVLSVLLVQTQDMSAPQLFRGTNMEVSMPTGSLCAERNVIGSALAQHPALKREDIQLIAVLALPPFESTTTTTATATAGSDMAVAAGTSGMRRVASTSTITSTTDRKISIGSEYDDYYPNADQNTTTMNNNSRKSSIGSIDEGEWILPTTTTTTATTPVEFVALKSEAVSSSSLAAAAAVTSAAWEEPAVMAATTTTTTTTTAPLRRIPLFTASQKSRRTVVIHSHSDLNPLHPCGTCQEWLKKIAETNPYFRIITFTDANCNGIYVERCPE